MTDDRVSAFAAFERRVRDGDLAGAFNVAWHAGAAAGWDEGESDGRWNSEHEFMIVRKLRTRLENPHRGRRA